MKKIVGCLLLLLFLSWCSKFVQDPQNIENNSWSGCVVWDDSCTNENLNQISFDIWEYSLSVLKTLKEDDMQSFSKYVDPNLWVKFSVYWYMTDDDVVLQKEQLLWSRDELITRWMYDWSGDPIIMTIREYFKNFVYNQDYSQAPEVLKWDMITRGNSIININEYYPNADCIEYYFPSFNPDYGWMDRESLVLIFDKTTHYLIWIAHEQATF